MSGFVALDGVSHRYGGAEAGRDAILAVENLTISRQPRRIRRGCRPVRLRQVHPDEARDRAAISLHGHVHVAGAAVSAAAQDRRHGVPGADAAALAHHAGKPAAAARDRAAASQQIRRKKAEYVDRAEKLLASVGLGGFGSKYPWELSGGMQQRTSLCRALIHEPQLLMLDEPFGALDAFTREELWGVIRDLHAAREITVVLVTHDLREAVFLADRVFVMSARPGPHRGRAPHRAAASARS